MPYDRQLLAIFSGEQAEHIQRLRALTDALPNAPVDHRDPMFQEALRRAHTIKGAARAVGLEPTEQLSHRLETLFAEAAKSPSGLTRDAAAEVRAALDGMEDILSAALRESPAHEPSISDGPGTPSAPGAGEGEFLRVTAANVDRLVRDSSQMIALFGAHGANFLWDGAPARADLALIEFEALHRSSLPFLRAHEDDPEAAPVRECLDFVNRELHAIADESRVRKRLGRQREWELRRQAAEVHGSAVKVRMIPAESVFGAFGAMVRRIAQEDGKTVAFRAEGLEVQADRMVLQSLKDAVMHLLRNAVSHGIETLAERIAAGKDQEGSVRLRFEADGSRLTVTVEDDGRGLDTAAIRRRGVAFGLVAEAEASQDERKLADLLFLSGFSTSEEVTKLSGRGVGLSVVKETADRLHGKVEVRTLAPSGLAVAISVGLSVSTQQVLILETAGRTFGIPTQHIRQVARARVSTIRSLSGREVLALGGENVPVARLADLLGLVSADNAPLDEERDPWMPVAVVTFGGQTVGLIVNSLVDEREAVVKDLGLPKRASGLTAGGVVLEDGRVALLLAPGMIVERLLAGECRALRPPDQPAAPPAPKILIVDDSLTTRSLERSILEAHGFRVTVSVDGIDALEKLAAERFDLVITDVAMPRMDGMQLLAEMKKRKSIQDIPVIMLTSMESRQDQEKGMALGADAYLVKRKFDPQELLRTVRQIL